MTRRKSQLGQKKPLFRKVNTRARNVRHNFGGEARWDRAATKTVTDDTTRGSMRSDRQNGLDYSPLFKFLLSRVGDDWDDVYSEAVRRLDKPDPIFWMVSETRDDRHGIFCISESTHFSRLFVDENSRLQILDPSITVETQKPSCSCCTHTLNGVVFTQKFEG